MLSPSFLIESSSELLVIRTGKNAQASLIGLWFPWPNFLFSDVLGNIHFQSIRDIWKNNFKLEQVDSTPSHIPAPAPSHISLHIKIPNVFFQSLSIGLLPVTFGATPPGPTPRGCIKSLNIFLQSSSIELLPVTVSRFELKKPKRSWVTIKKRTQNPTFWPLVTPPRHAPLGQNFCTTLFYSS